ncbi:MAG: glutamate racemase [Clostridia bacterium]|nr:glutamate racemase [Clostridia bacterium]
MDKKELPIAVFDSGLGGISVLRRICGVLPEEKYIYFGDSANAPYGEKSPEWILERCRAITESFIRRGVKAIVVACNTATGVAAKALRAEYPDIPIIGLEPALKPAVESERPGAVIVMATPVTLESEKFKALLSRFKEEREIILMPAPRLVSFVENGIYEGDEIESYIAKLIEPYSGADIASVVLGCTHFPFLKKSIEKVVGDVDLYDGAFGTAKETLRRLTELDLLSRDGDGHIMMENSLGKDEIIDRSWELFEREL